MALSEYVLLVSLSAGIHLHGNAGGISVGPEAITQPNGGARVAAQKFALKYTDSKHKSLNSLKRATPPQGNYYEYKEQKGVVSPQGIKPLNTAPTVRMK